MYTVVSHRTGSLYIHHIPIGLLETIKENRHKGFHGSACKTLFYFLCISSGAGLDNEY